MGGREGGGGSILTSFVPLQSTYYMEGNTGHKVFHTQFGELSLKHFSCTLVGRVVIDLHATITNSPVPHPLPSFTA
jgi:hypothetical protein